MSEYTPTTEEVRNAAHNKAFFPLFRDRADFDRWLAAHDAEVRDDYEGETAERLSQLLWHLTGGRLSKSTYDVSTMVAQIEDTFERERSEEVRAGVVAEEPEGGRWFSAAYRAQNGNIIPIGDETVLAEYAQKTVDEFSREDDEGPDYFLASRILSPWVPVKQEGADA